MKSNNSTPSTREKRQAATKATERIHKTEAPRSSKNSSSSLPTRPSKLRFPQSGIVEDYKLMKFEESNLVWVYPSKERKAVGIVTYWPAFVETVVDKNAGKNSITIKCFAPITAPQDVYEQVHMDFPVLMPYKATFEDFGDEKFLKKYPLLPLESGKLYKTMVAFAKSKKQWEPLLTKALQDAFVFSQSRRLEEKLVQYQIASHAEKVKEHLEAAGESDVQVLPSSRKRLAKSSDVTIHSIPDTQSNKKRKTEKASGKKSTKKSQETIVIPSTLPSPPKAEPAPILIESSLPNPDIPIESDDDLLDPDALLTSSFVSSQRSTLSQDVVQDPTPEVVETIETIVEPLQPVVEPAPLIARPSGKILAKPPTPPPENVPKKKTALDYLRDEGHDIITTKADDDGDASDCLRPDQGVFALGRMDSTYHPAVVLKCQTCENKEKIALNDHEHLVRYWDQVDMLRKRSDLVTRWQSEFSKIVIASNLPKTLVTPEERVKQDETLLKDLEKLWPVITEEVLEKKKGLRMGWFVANKNHELLLKAFVGPLLGDDIDVLVTEINHHLTKAKIDWVDQLGNVEKGHLIRHVLIPEFAIHLVRRDVLKQEPGLQGKALQNRIENKLENGYKLPWYLELLEARGTSNALKKKK